MSNSSESAYPTVYQMPDEMYPCIKEGLTKREFFAAMAMQGLLSAETEHSFLSTLDLAKTAVEKADALLTALENF